MAEEALAAPSRWRWLPPPLIYAAAVLAGLGLQWAFPIAFLPAGWGRALGAALALAGLGLMAWVSLVLWRRGTPILPLQQAEALVTEGPFRLSRNPIYLGDTLVQLGVAAWFNSLWVLALVPVAMAGVTRIHIAWEEAALAARFGAAYAAYRARVRRWL